MHFCTCQQPMMNGGMMMGQGGPGFQQAPYPMSNQMTPTMAMAQGAGMMDMMNGSGQSMAQGAGQMGMESGPRQLPMEQSYIENILRLNRGKPATVYMTFEGEGPNNQTNFRGIIEAAGRDHIVLSDPQTGERYLLLMVYLDYVKFDEEIEYSYPIGQLATYSPR